MEQKYPLTKQQEGLWVEWRLHPDNTSYNTCVKLRLTGKLDKDRFEQGLQHVVDFFSSLRVYFQEENGLPTQHIKDKGEFELEYEDHSDPNNPAVETPEQQKKAKAFLERKLRTPVNLMEFPIVRAGLAKTAEDIHYFIGTVPHMISDGTSAILFLEATSIAYNEGYEGLEQAYSKDLKDWSHYFTEEKLKHDEEQWKNAANYWNERLLGAQHTVDFSYGQQEANNSNKTGKRVYFDLSKELSGALKVYSRKQRTTLFSTLIGTFSMLLHRYYQQDDILIGYPVNIRPPGYKYLFGFFVNIIPIRIDLSGDPTYEELVGRISAARKSDKKFQTFPALDIVREVRKNVSGFDGRVFNASMAQTVSRLVNLRLDGIESEPLEAEYNDVNDDLSLSYEILEDDRIGLWLEYRESFFTKDFIDQMIAHMRSLLQQVADDPHQKISDYTLVTEAEKTRLLENFGQPEQNLDTQNTIHGMIEAHAQKSPDEIALTFKDQTITYREMETQANKIANLLVEKGVQPQDRVGICLRRGPEMIYCLLAVMKAGCTYIALPPCSPQERLSFILGDSEAKIVLTQEELMEDFAEADQQIINLTTETLDAYTSDAPAVKTKSEDLAYILYTSGSTGTPKGVLIQHQNVVPRLQWLQDDIPLTEKDIVLQNTDYSFDVSVAEIFWPLTTGATLVLTDPEKYKDPSYLIDLIKTQNVTTSLIVPSLLNSMLAVLKDDTLPSLKQVLAAGEALPPSLVKAYYEKCGGTLYNVYGPTEAAIYAAAYTCPKDVQMDCVPIGKPLSNTMLYILDEHMEPQPFGVAGELHIGGDSVAQGYINRDDLTAEKFISDPFSKDKNARLYKTGDLVRFDIHGNIEYLGRIDAQVKIRGFRIELAEIETVLAQAQGIQDVAVIDYGAAETKRLIAYYVSEEELDHDALKTGLAKKLPDYMQPAFFIRIDAIPRLSSGKINRKALPNPEQMLKKSTEYTAPETELQKELVAIWANILKIPKEKIGIHDSFFDIGGDSLMAIQFVCAADEKGIHFETDTLFTTSTIAELANIVQDGSSKEKIDQSPVSGTFPLLPRQAKFFADDYENPHHWNRYFFFETDHNPDIDHLQKAFDIVLMHHDNLRISFTQDTNGTWHQNCEDTLPDEKYIFSYDLRGLDETTQEEKIVTLSNEHHTAIRLDTAPLIRVLYFKTEDDKGKLGVVIHHLLLDIVSSRIIFEDLLKTYEGLRHNIAFPLPAKTTSVKDWTLHLMKQIDEADFTDNLNYWTSDDMIPAPTVPVDYKDDKLGREADAAVETVTIDAQTTEKILQDIPKQTGYSIQDFLLSSLLEATSDWSGEDKLVVNICGHGRDSAKGHNVSRTVGWLNTVFPVSLTRTDNVLAGVQEQLRSVPKRNGDYNLLRYSAQNKDILKYPNPDIFFNYVSQLDAIIPDGISLSPAYEPKGILSSDPKNHLSYLLYAEAGIYERKLTVHITYSTAKFKPETIKRFSALFEKYISKNVLQYIDDNKASLAKKAVS